MLIACPNCTTSYQLEATALGARGRSVRCVRCRTVWFAPAAVEPAGEEAAFRAELGPEIISLEPDPAESVEALAADAVADLPAETSPEPPPALIIEAPELAPVAAGAAPERLPEEPRKATPVALSEIPIPVEHAPPLAPAASGQSPMIENVAGNIESIARRRNAGVRKRKAQVSAAMHLPLLIGGLAVVCAALLGFRKDIVRHMPQIASFYASIGMPVNLRGLAFADLKLGRDTHDGVPVLAVEGTIVNDVSGPVEVPRLRFALRNAAGAEVYSWTAVPSQSVLEPGARLPFRSRLASPPEDGTDLQVRFFTRRDAAAGLN